MNKYKTLYIILLLISVILFLSTKSIWAHLFLFLMFPITAFLIQLIYSIRTKNYLWVGISSAVIVISCIYFIPNFMDKI
ncbi:hypothetical protein IMZ08_18710 [Bacillus luteolus]|uniref:Uncharacterized protein n=1 Tax=Litchfieldia luteola TaxID=682179 RepID=A0ABR9QNK2_9BACI|nr:hypothetical protein [Cytobacillus luteolus]MBE4910072.1 hypothetical protein [Cytobacillus luteolus]MBP1942365.1 putative membrane protein [Cytobacillus luteolus]